MTRRDLRPGLACQLTFLSQDNMPSDPPLHHSPARPLAPLGSGNNTRMREKIMRFGVQLPRLTPASLLLPRVLPPGPSCPPRTPSCRSGACPAAAPGMPGPEPPRPPTRCQFSPRSSPSPSRPPCCALLLSATITG